LLALGTTDPRPQDGPVLQAAAPSAAPAPAGSVAGQDEASGTPSAATGRTVPGGTGRQGAVDDAAVVAAARESAVDAAKAHRSFRPAGFGEAEAGRAPRAEGRSAGGERLAAISGSPVAHERVASAPSFQQAAAGLPDGGATEEPAQRLARLRRERERLLSELAALRQAVPAQRPPELLLGGDETFELVLDLQAAGRETLGAPAGGYQPASLDRRAPAPHRL
ncbi:MAG TPA: hypothetical protein VHQ65_07460, partial [Thermoanaerobaculia bacterium]|nr:hypothetical protein [Thermoanaerobaculia bacterium]